MIEVLKKCSFFSGLNGSELAKIVKISKNINTSKDEILFYEGDKANNLYILILGTVDLIKTSLEGKEQLVRRVERNEMFAEAAVFSEGSYPVTAISRKKCELLIISNDKLQKLVSETPQIAFGIIAVMSNLLRHLNQVIKELSLTKVESRLASFLIKRMHEEKSDSFQLGVSKKELAFKLGTISETLSRNFRKMVDGKCIEVNGNNVKIKNMEKLKKLIYQ